MDNAHDLDQYLAGKPGISLDLFECFANRFRQVGNVEFIPAKTMIGVATPRKRIAWVTQFGRNFLHVVFPFPEPYQDNLCFQKVVQVPGQQQFNHHLRMFSPEDINDEVLGYMEKAYLEGI